MTAGGGGNMYWEGTPPGMPAGGPPYCGLWYIGFPAGLDPYELPLFPL